ncbi:MAG: GGDEF domain-containing protein [Lachnospiraceae bacterium]|nr:GGDEF domain-containing protein [Lachnospiraceae bacterium]
MDNSAVYYRISKLYDSFVTSTGTKSRYFFMLDISSDVARWSQEAVTDFALPGEYVHYQSQVFRELLAPEDAEEFASDIAAITARRLEKKDASWRLLDRNGNYLSCAVKYFAVKDYASAPAYIAGVITSQGVEPHTDPTTSLPNQVRFLEYLRQLFVTGRRAVIMLIGTTNFAEINTLYGYTFGNKVLAALADHLKEISNGAGQLFRGEGTMLLFCSEIMTESEMRRLYTGQRNYARHMLTVDNTRINVRLSAGIVVADDPTIDVHALLACAKFAQTKSQNEVEGEPVVLQNDYLNDNGKTIELVNRIHSDVENDCRNFALFYQPIIKADDDRLIGSAAFLRWDCEPYGRISPAEFLLWLENDNSFSRLGNWILKTAIREGKKILERTPDLILNVNLANRQLEQPEFHQQLLSFLKEQNFPAKNLCLELTDRCRFLNADFLKREVIYLRSCGIHVALDGSCLLDLRLVRSLPVDIIKVGRDFVSHMKSNQKDQALLRALCAFAAESDIMICAEGISDEETLAMIKEYDIYAYQGFVATGPVPFADFMKLPMITSKR